MKTTTPSYASPTSSSTAWREKMKIDEELAALADEYEAKGVPAQEALSRFKAIAALLWTRRRSTPAST